MHETRTMRLRLYDNIQIPRKTLPLARSHSCVPNPRQPRFFSSCPLQALKESLVPPYATGRVARLATASRLGYDRGVPESRVPILAWTVHAVPMRPRPEPGPS